MSFFCLVHETVLHAGNCEATWQSHYDKRFHTRLAQDAVNRMGHWRSAMRERMADRDWQSDLEAALARQVAAAAVRGALAALRLEERPSTAAQRDAAQQGDRPLYADLPSDSSDSEEGEYDWTESETSGDSDADDDDYTAGSGGSDDGWDSDDAGHGSRDMSDGSHGSWDSGGSGTTSAGGSGAGVQPHDGEGAGSEDGDSGSSMDEDGDGDANHLPQADLLDGNGNAGLIIDLADTPSEPSTPIASHGMPAASLLSGMHANHSAS